MPSIVCLIKKQKNKKDLACVYVLRDTEPSGDLKPESVKTQLQQAAFLVLQGQGFSRYLLWEVGVQNPSFHQYQLPPLPLAVCLLRADMALRLSTCPPPSQPLLLCGMGAITDPPSYR